MYKKILKKIIVLCVTINLYTTNVMAQNNLDLKFLYNWNDTSLVGSYYYNNVYNDTWGFERNGRQYGIIGSTQGTHIFDVTDANDIHQVALIEGAVVGDEIIHRDFHDYNNYLYIVADEGYSTLQIVDISQLPDTAIVMYNSNELLERSHTIFIDTSSALLYTCAVKDKNNDHNALKIFSLKQDPLNPLPIATYNDVGHVHDMYVRRDTAYLNCGYDGLRIMNAKNMPNYTIIGSLTQYYEAGYNHSSWLSENGKIYAFTDEDHGYSVKIADVSDLSDIKILANIKSGVDANSIAHTVAIKNNYLYIAYYHDGLYIYDISNPQNPILQATFDTYTPTDHDSYRGAWGVYVFPNTDIVLVSDMQYGFFVFEAKPKPTTAPALQMPALEPLHVQLNYAENKKIQVQIQPNNAEFSTSYTVQLYDFNGKLIYEKNAQQTNFDINLQYKNKGVYILKITSANANTPVFLQKIVMP